MNQVKEIIIASGTHREEIKQFVRDNEFKRQVKIDVKGIKPDSESVGDAIREISEMGVLRDDFLVVRGDIITNISIKDALEFHWNVKALEAKKENQTTDTRKNKTIMTKLFVRQSSISHLRDPSTDFMLMMDGQTKEIFKYQTIQQDSRKVAASMKLNEEHIKIEKSYGRSKPSNQQFECNNVYPNSISMELRFDLADSEIAICSKEVLDHFSDNFDKSSLKDGFINWLYESEIIEDRVRAFEVCQQGVYMARLVDPRMYGIITQDVLARKAFPLVIDKASIDPKANYDYKLFNSYIDQSAVIAINSKTSHGCAIARDISIDSNCDISQSVIGSGCKIGKNVTIENSIIYSDVKIRDNSHITNAII